MFRHMTTTNDTTVLETPAPLIPPNAVVAEHGMGETQAFDYVGYVRNIAEGKRKNGTMQFMRGNGLFNSVCQALKSKLGLAKDKHLPGDVASAVSTAVELIQQEALSLVDERNLSSVSKRNVLRGLRILEVITIRGTNALSFKDEAFVARGMRREVEAKIASAEIAYKDTSKLEERRAKLHDAELLANAHENELNSLVGK